MLQKIARWTLIILNLYFGFFLLGTLGMLEMFQPISMLRIIGCIVILAFQLFELAVIWESEL